VQTTPTFTNAQSLAPSEFRRWVLHGTTVAIVAYGAFVIFEWSQDGAVAALTGQNAVMMLLMSVAYVVAARVDPRTAAVLALAATCVDQLSGVPGATQFPRSAMMQLPPLLMAAGLLLGARAAFIVAVVMWLALTGAAMVSPAMQAGMTPEAVRWLLSTAVALFASWGLIALTMRSFRRMFQTMRTTQRDYADTIRFTPHGIIVVDPAGSIMLINEAAERLLGQRSDAVTGRPIAVVLGRLGTAGALAPLADWTATAPIEVSVRLPDDLTLHLEGTWRTMAGERHQLLLHDVSTRIAAEQHRQQIETQLAHSQRLDAVGRLAGGLSHDFNNILTAVSGSAEMLRYERNPAEREALLDEIIAARDRGSALTRQLLAFARREVTQPRVVDLAEHVRGLERLLTRVAGDRSRVRFVLTSDCRVRVDPGQLEQTLVNLVANARDAMPEGGTCTITVEQVADARATAHVRLHVADEGVGMPPDVAERAFEPFFTTKPRGQGTGLGLASVHGMAEQSGGTAQIASTQGRGTRVTIELPASEEEEASSTEVPPTRVADATGCQTVLVAEDDSGTRRIVERLLRHAGYVVRTAADGAEAMAFIEDGSVAFDLLLTDVMMPGFTGPQLADRVRALHPGRPVLLMTGYAEDQLARLLDTAARREVITKPFSGIELTSRIAELLRSAVPVTA